MPFYLAVFDG